MTPHDESGYYSEVTMLMPLLTTRTTVDIDTWSVRTMWETERNNQLATGIRKMLWTSETHWTQAGYKKMHSIYMLLYFGQEYENTKHTNRVIQMLSKEVRKAFSDCIHNEVWSLEMTMCKFFISQLWVKFVISYNVIIIARKQHT